MTYDDMVRIKREAARRWPQDFEQQIRAIEERCKTYHHAHQSPVMGLEEDMVTVQLERAKYVYRSLCESDRSAFRQWLECDE